MQRSAAYSLYILALSLWTGGIAIYTFVVTPAVFRSFNRDTASKVVDALFGGYFTYNLVLSVLAVLLFMAVRENLTARRLSAILLALAVVMNLYVSFWLYPQVREVKTRIADMLAHGLATRRGIFW